MVVTLEAVNAHQPGFAARPKVCGARRDEYQAASLRALAEAQTRCHAPRPSLFDRGYGSHFLRRGAGSKNRDNPPV
jgi:hypothetical protein